MADPTEQNPPAPAPVPVASAGLIDRLKSAMGFKPEPVEEDAVVAGLRLEVEALTGAVTDATAKIEELNGILATEQAARSASEAKVSAIEAALPGITASADPSKFITDEVVKRTAEQAAAAGIPENEAPSNQAPPDQSDKTKTWEEFQALTPSEQNAFMSSGGKVSK